jgi:hypothetical protein
MERKNLLLGCAIVTIAAVAVITIFLFAFNRSPAPPALPKQVTISGTLACLPHKNAQPGQVHTLECAIGLRTSDQRYYGLQEMPDGAGMTDFTTTVEVSGELSAPLANDLYDVVGNIKVSSFKTK